MKTLEATKTHETVWSGRIEPEQLHAILLEALRRSFSNERYGMSLRNLRVEPAAAGASNRLPAIAFELVHDHEWYSKADGRDAVAEPAA